MSARKRKPRQPVEIETEPTNSPELAEYIKKGEESVNAWLARYALILIGSGVHRVYVSYSGGGDSGQIDAVRYLGPDKGTRQNTRTHMTWDAQNNLQETEASYTEEIDRDVIEDPWAGSSLDNQFQNFLYDLLDARGWEVNNEGSQGSFTWDLDADTLDHHHETNITSVEVQEFDSISDLRGSIDPDDPGRHV